MKEKLQASLKDALRAKDKIRLNTIRSVISAIQYSEMQNDTEPLSDQAVTAILKNELKKRKEALEFSEKAGRTEEKQSLLQEMSCIEEFLPQQLSEYQLEKIVADIKNQNPEINFGQIMKSLKDSYFGQYDGKTASEVVKKVLG